MNKQDFIRQIYSLANYETERVYITFRYGDLELNTELLEFRYQMQNINITDGQDINIVEINNDDDGGLDVVVVVE